MTSVHCGVTDLVVCLYRALLHGVWPWEELKMFLMANRLRLRIAWRSPFSVFLLLSLLARANVSSAQALTFDDAHACPRAFSSCVASDRSSARPLSTHREPAAPTHVSTCLHDRRAYVVLVEAACFPLEQLGVLNASVPRARSPARVQPARGFGL